MRNNIFVAFLIALVFTSYAQLNINSPYSRFGIGDLKESGFVHNRAMGGIGASNGELFYINNVNPAVLQRSKYTIYEIGLQNPIRTLESTTSTTTNADLNLDYLALSIPVNNKWKFAVGLNQYSQVNYDINSTESINDQDQVEYNYTGRGGLNKFYLSNAYRIVDDTSSGTTISLGLEASYLFGQIEQNQSSQLLENGSSIDEIISFRNDNAYTGSHIKPGISLRKEVLYYNTINIKSCCTSY